MAAADHKLAIWFPTVRVGTGSDVFTIRLVDALQQRGVRAEITWLPHHAEYAPWLITPPSPPSWATLVHINSWLPSRFIPKHLPLVTTVHHCVHNIKLDIYKSFAQYWYHRLWVYHCEAANLKQSKIITTVSSYTAAQVTKVFRYNKLIPIHNGIDTKIFQSNNRYKIQKPLRLLFVGSLNKRKGKDLLPSIMRLLGNDFELRYTGFSNNFDINLPSNMISVGRPISETDLIALYHNNDALLFPTRLEGFGLVALEAQACGLPVITTNGSSMPEVVVDGVTGFLCPQDDVTAFAAAARRLAHDNNLWRNMSIAARIRAERFFDISNMVDRYLEVYQIALNH